MQGVVKWFNKEKGFGFITSEGGHDYFCHYSEVVGEGYKFLDQDEKVEFEIQESSKGELAINIIKLK